MDDFLPILDDAIVDYIKGQLRNSKTPESRENESGILDEILSLLVIK